MTSLTEFLDGAGIPYEELPHERAFTGIEEARVLGLDADEVLKTVIVDANDRHVAVVVPSAERLDMHLVREAVGDPHATLATEDEIERDFAGFELGALPPVAPLLDVETIVDPSVREHGEVIFAAGTQTRSVKVATRDLLEAQGVRFADVTHP
jgi:Cys-tRNA(Pro) deacylase